MEVTVMRNKHTGQVLYLEAGSDFVDLLLSFLLLPLGSIVQRMKPTSLGAITNIANSIGSNQLGERFLSVSSATLLAPTVGLESKSCMSRPAKLLKMDVRSDQPQTYYSCRTNIRHGCDLLSCPGRDLTCPRCKTPMQQITIPPIESLALGIVKDPCGSLKFFVTDDLAITPASTVKCLDLLQKMNVNMMADVESSVILVGEKEALHLLLAAFTSMSVLSDIFSVTYSAATEQNVRT